MNNLYNKNIVSKPWGEEYVIFSEKVKTAITFLKILPGKETSLHCHSVKKTGFIIISGLAKVQIGIYKKNSFIYKPLSRLVFRQGLFHKISNAGKKNLYALEFECPYLKNDLIRLDDKYGRSKTRYEGKKFFKPIDKKTIIFKKLKKNEKKNKYNLINQTIYLNKVKSSKDIITKGSKSSVAILNGRIVNKQNQSVISAGEIVKSETLKFLCKKFKIQKELLLLEVQKRK